MDASPFNAEGNQPNLKVSISARLIAALSYAIPVIGGALSSILMIRVFQALSANETAGIVAVMTAMKEASLPVTVSFYLAAACGIVLIIFLVIRMTMQTKTASPPAWFFVVGGILCLLPAGLFWKAQSMVIEVLSPGSSIGADGVASVGENISQLLILSVIAAPIIFILLVVVAVLPFRSKAKWSSLAAATVIEILLVAVAVALPFLIGEPKRKNELVNLPANVKDADSDYDIDKETSVILTLTADNKLHQRHRNLSGKAEKTETVITNKELPEKLEKSMADKSPDQRIVYLKVDVNVRYGDVSEIFDIIRKADVDKVGLVVVGEKNEDDPYQTTPLRFEVKLPLEPTDELDVAIKPNPLTLVAMLEKDGKLTLNREDKGLISDTKRFENMLAEIFKERENNGVFREGTNEVEKTVFLKVSKSSSYGDFIKLVEAVKSAGAQPIGIQMDDLNL